MSVCNKDINQVRVNGLYIRPGAQWLVFVYLFACNQSKKQQLDKAKNTTSSNRNFLWCKKEMQFLCKNTLFTKKVVLREQQIYSIFKVRTRRILFLLESIYFSLHFISFHLKKGTILEIFSFFIWLWRFQSLKNSYFWRFLTLENQFNKVGPL